MRKYYEQLYTNIIDNLYEMTNFSRRNKKSEQTHDK
jgi:hypothetical protein